MYCKFLFTFCLCFTFKCFFKKILPYLHGWIWQRWGICLLSPSCIKEHNSATDLCLQPWRVRLRALPTSNQEQCKEQQAPSPVHQNLKQPSRDGGGMPRQRTPGQAETPQPRKALLPPERLSTCCPGGWRRRGARSAARSWAAGSGRTSGRRSAPRRPSPPLPSSAAHVSAPAREQRRGPAWTSTGTPSPAGRPGPSSSRGLSPGCQGSRPRPRGSPISIDCTTRPGAPEGGGGPWGRGGGVGSLTLGNWKPAGILQGLGRAALVKFFFLLCFFSFSSSHLPPSSGRLIR